MPLPENGRVPRNGGSDAPSDDERAARWRTALALLVLLLLAELLFYRETVMSMALIWARSGTFTHGFLVLPISLWLIWRERGTLAGMEPAPDPRFALGISACGFAWLLGRVAAVAPVAQFALIGNLTLTVAALLGARIFLSLGFPLAFLLFAVPFGEFLVPRLMQWTADFTVMALRFSGVPVYREGLRFMIPSGSWSVAEACSGVRYVIASSMLGTLFACLTYRTLRRRLVFIGVSLIVPIFANWLRAYLIVMLGHLSGNTLAVGVDHLIYGWLFFGVIILIMFRIGTRWREEAGPKSAGEPEVSRTGIGAHRRGLSTAFLASAVLAALWPLLWRHVERNTLPELTRLEAPAAPAGWVGSERNLPDWAPRFTTASASLRRGYAKIGESGRNVGLFLAYYRNQDENRKLVSSGNALVKGSDHDWEETETGTAAALVQGMPLRVRTSELLSAAGERLFVWQWYWINGRWTANDYLAKAYTALSRLTGEGDDSAVVIVYTAGGEGSDPDAILRDFTAAASPVLWNALQETRHGHE